MKKKSWYRWTWEKLDNIVAVDNWNSISLNHIFIKKNRILGAEKEYRKVRITITELPTTRKERKG